MTVLNKQRGSTLLVALVMLMLLTLIAFAAMNASTTSIQVVGNAQFREEANTAAQQAIEGVISSDFTPNPVSSVVTVNVGGTNYVATVAVPICKSSLPIPFTDLDQTNVDDRDCLPDSAAQNTGTMNASGPVATSQVSCNKQMWEVNATVDNSDTGAKINVHQGVSLRVPVETGCP